MKKIISILIALLLTLSAGCKDPNAGPVATATLVIRTEAPSTPTTEPTIAITALPTATKEPIATVEPGKETYAGGIKDANVGTKFSYIPDGGRTDHRMVNESLAQQFFATTSFNKIEIDCPSYSDNKGTLVLELLKWQGTYIDTINREKNPPTVKKEIVDYLDNQILTMEFDTLPDGEYVLYLTTPKKEEQVGVWARYELEESALKSRAYADDTIWEGGSFGPTIYYTKTPNVLYGVLQDSGL